MNSTVKTIVWLIVVVLIIWGGWSLLKRPGETTPQPEGPIKIGFIGPLTGDAAYYGEPMRDVVELAAEEINTLGGINGQPLEIIYEDGKCAGKDAANAAQKLVNVDKVQVILGGFCSSESLSAQPITSQAKVFLFSGGSSSPDLTNIDKFFARTYPSDASQGEVLANVVYSDKDWRKIAFLQEQLDYPLGIFNAFKENFEALGGEVVKEEFLSGATDFRSQLTKLRAEKPDAFFIDVQAWPAAERIFKQFQELDWEIPLLVSDSIAGEPKIAEHAELLEGALAAEFGVDPENPKFQTLLANYQERFGTEAPYQSYSQTIYDTVYMLRDGIAAVGYDGILLAQWIRDVENWQGASGLVDIAENGDRVGGHVPKIIKDGKTILYTAAAETVE